MLPHTIEPDAYVIALSDQGKPFLNDWKAEANPWRLYHATPGRPGEILLWAVPSPALETSLTDSPLVAAFRRVKVVSESDPDTWKFTDRAAGVVLAVEMARP